MDDVSDWYGSPEQVAALKEWETMNDDIEFHHSQPFANARNAWRRRVNNSPYGETT